jgi:hypothetical protein
MRFSEEADPRFFRRVDEYVDRVKNQLPYVRGYHLMRNVASRSAGFEWVIVSTFDNSAAHDEYQVSTVHQEMKAFMGPYITEIVACDGSVE